MDTKLARLENVRIKISIVIGCSFDAERYAVPLMSAGADDVWQKPLPSTAEIQAKLKTISKRLSLIKQRCKHRHVALLENNLMRSQEALRVLIIDDSVLQRKVMVKKLTRLGCQVITR